MQMKRLESRIYAVYSASEDITFVMREEYDTCTEEVVTLEVTGFYHGEPDARSTKEFNGRRKAVYTI